MVNDYTIGDTADEFLSACGATTAFGIASGLINHRST
jgi:hypothetical protein